MKELIAEKDGMKIKTIIEGAMASETITLLRKRGFQSFTIRSILDVPKNYNNLNSDFSQFMSAN